ncbi:PEPxxWA-CTERM sorting domain-containing protein [Sphingomonas sp. MAH-20]|uniref:PEPxxWA-CTERM sorting domain-containing protein n=2 Tax=Sphingomonadaceae TaxID=41297 RepID=A0A6I4J591_9SPHN|nr:PEPxxWA-CTERM sorting domain-containing protein [Sphingomonas horti]
MTVAERGVIMKKLLWILAPMAMAGASANAATITGLFNTGTDSNNVALVGGNGTVDPHYSIFSSTSPGFAGQQAVTFQCCYVADDADSRWVSLSANGNPGSNVTFYRLSFSLAGLDPTTASISGSGGSDNAGRIFLNGVDTGIDINGFSALVPFVLNSGFVAGVNTLDIRVSDFGAPTAFRIDNLTGTASPMSGIPEPAVWAMLIAGFGLIGGAARRRPLAAA